jgi:ADP-ribose pyrophosphatase YjhB (NUDIX family)
LPHPLIRKLTFPLVALYWLICKPQGYGVKALVLRGAGEAAEALLVRHSYGDGTNWNLPGGGYKPNQEAAEAAMRRELREELGTAPAVLTWLCEYKTNAQGKADTVQVFIATLESEPKPADGEVAEARWHKLSDLHENKAYYRIIRTAVAAYIAQTKTAPGEGAVL